MSQCVSKFLGHVDVNIEKSRERLKGVTLENLDIIDLINKYDSKDTLFYLDPPYVADTRVAKKVYKHEMADEKHIEMVDKLLEVKGKVILSGYDNEIYERLVDEGWDKFILGEYVKRSGKGSKGEEMIWKNY